MDSYPQSTYRADAKLGLADTYLGEGSAESNVLAVNEYREFLSFYPTHPRAYYAQFKLGMCHFYQMHGPDRDQTETHEAIAELTTFVQRYRERSPLLDEGRARLRDARDRLSDSDYRVAVLLPEDAEVPTRGHRSVQGDPQRRSGIQPARRRLLLPRAGADQGEAGQAEALPLLDRLVREFESSEYLEQAKKLIDTLKAEPTRRSPKKGACRMSRSVRSLIRSSWRLSRVRRWRRMRKSRPPGSRPGTTRPKSPAAPVLLRMPPDTSIRIGAGREQGKALFGPARRSSSRRHGPGGQARAGVLTSGACSPIGL